MSLFRLSNNNLQEIKTIKFDLESDLQQITEKNLESIFGLKFITSEFSLHNFRIDTLAFDEETSSFVIIEFKKDRSFSVIDQGYAYLSLLLNNKADFILEYNEKNTNFLKRDNIDWSQSRVIFIAANFTPYQLNAINFKDLPLELWEVKKYENNIIHYDQLKSPETSESIKTVSKSKTINSVSKEVKHYSVDDHFKQDWTQSKAIFEGLREKIMDLDSKIEESPQKYYIGYKIGKFVLVSLKIQKSKVILEIPRFKPKDLKDPENKVTYQKDSFKFFNKHISEFFINIPSDIDYAIFLVKQIYEKFYK